MNNIDHSLPPIKRDIIWRIALIYFAALVIAILIIGKIIYLQFFESEKWAEKATTIKDLIIESNRGDILADDNKLLATSLPSYEVHLDLKSEALTNEVFQKNVDSLAFCLTKLFKDKSKNEYLAELKNARQNGERYYLLKNRINYQQLKKLKTFPIFRLGRYKGGFIYERTNTRIRPHYNLAARTVGYIKEDGNAVGIEGAYDNELRGTKGLKLVQRIANGVWMPLNDGNEVEPEDGNDILTTLNIYIQDVAEKALQEQMIRSNADHGCVIVMEVKTGDIKAMVNLKRGADLIFREEYNYAIGESTEPGSTFKLASLIAAFEDNYIKPTDSIETGNGIVLYGNFPIRDAYLKGYGKISVQEAFELSSNVGISKIIHKFYKEKPKKFVEKLFSMNLNEKLNIDIKGEGLPYIKSPRDNLWSSISLPQMSIGYEVRLTPLQLLTFYNAIANNGKMMKPRFVTAVQKHGFEIKNFPTEVLNSSICSPSTIKKVKKMLEGVVLRGTAKNLRNANYKIAGKTGTAQIAKGKKGYKNNDEISYQASFVGYFPAEKPLYSCIVVIYDLSSEFYYGNVVAGPVFREITDKIFAMRYDVQPDISANKRSVVEIPVMQSGFRTDFDEICKKTNIPFQNRETGNWVQTVERKGKVEFRNLEVRKNVVPNVVRMGASDAIFLLENLGLKVVLHGRGIIKKQSLKSGESFKKGEKIILELE